MPKNLNANYSMLTPSSPTAIQQASFYDCIIATYTANAMGKAFTLQVFGDKPK